MGKHMRKKSEEYSFYWRYIISFGIFILLYAVGIILPLEVTLHYKNYMSRVWNWTEILILFLAVYYIFKTKVFQQRQAVISALLGAVCLISLFRDSRRADIIVTSVCVAAAFYAACRLYELANVENVSVHISVAGSVRYFCLGAVISVPLALVNILFISLSRQISVRNVISSAVFALKPAIAEEVVFRFFLLAYSYYLLRGKEKKRLFDVYIYILLILPHKLLHYPDLFLASPGRAVLMCILNGIFFGFPMAFLMKRKNLQMAMGMHWCIDFVRFAVGF